MPQDLSSTKVEEFRFMQSSVKLLFDMNCFRFETKTITIMIIKAILIAKCDLLQNATCKKAPVCSVIGLTARPAETLRQKSYFLAFIN